MAATSFGIIVLVVSCTIVRATSTHEDAQVEKCNDTCSTTECINYGNQILNFMKKEVDPCRDFYSFACGGYAEKFGRNDTKSVYDEAWNYLQIRIRDLLDNLQPTHESVSEKMKIMYNTCIASIPAELQGVSDAREFLNDLLNENWPNLNIDFELPSLTEVLGKLAAYGEFSFLTFKVTPYKIENPRLGNYQTALILPDQVLSNSKLKTKDIERTVFKILDYFNVGKDESRRIWKEFVKIENITLTLLNQETNNLQKCDEDRRSAFMSLNCSGDATEYFENVCNFWKSVVKHGGLENYFSEEILHISCRWNLYNYVENIFTKLADMNQRSLAHYLALRFFFAHLDDINLYFQLVKNAHSGVLGSKHKTMDAISRWEFCVAWIVKSMNLALGYEYTQKVFKEPVEEEVLDIIREYLNEMSNEVMSQNWINHRVKPYLKNQIEKLEIGFESSMKNYRNETFVTNYYNELHPVNGSFLKSVLEYQKVSVILNNKRKTHFNNFFSTSDPHTMDFGFALFIPPTYSYGMSKLLNYATLGFLVGHELSHNLQFALDLVELDEDTENHLRSKLQCYIEEYSKLVIQKTGKKITSSETKEEIVADNIGWSLTERILEKYLESADSHLYIPSSPYTSRQLVFIAFAQASCEVLSKTVEKEFYATSPQNLEKLRVIGIIQNSRAFSEAFHCPANTSINSLNKCVFFE